MRTPAIILVALFVGACSDPSSPESEKTDTSPIALEGAFGPKSDAESADIRFLSFEGERYQLVPRGCVDAACVEGGGFRVDRENDRLELTPDGERAPYSLPLVIRDTRANGAGALRPADLVNGSEGTLVDPSSSPLVATNVELVGREYELLQSKKNKKSHAGSASQLNLTLDEGELRRTSQQRAMENCRAAQTEVPANGTDHCKPGEYIWGNRIINTVAATACEPGRIYTTCTTIVTITTVTIE